MIKMNVKTGIVLMILMLMGTAATASEITTANGDIPVAGNVMGSYIDTHANDAIYENIVEWESGERLAKKRTSYLEHKWTFDVLAGDTFTFYIKAYHSANTEGDDFEFAWSTDDVGYTGVLVVTKTQDDGTYQSAALPSDLNGTVYIRVTDLDRTKDHRALDTLFIDHMYIESTVNASPPAAPSSLQASALSSSTINLGWSDNSGNEEGFRIERSLDGLTWDPPIFVGENITSFLDTNLSPDTTYYYRILAFNVYGESSWSNTASGTTHQESSFTTQMVDPNAQPFYFGHAINPISGFAGIGYPDDGLIQFAQWNGYTWEIEIAGSGGGQGMDVAYSPDGRASMSFGWGNLTFAEKIGSTWSFETIESNCYNDFTSLAYDPSGNPSIAYTRGGNKKVKGLKLAVRIGTTWITEKIESGTPMYKSLAYDLQGFPAVAYSGNDSLMYAHWNGSAWDIETVESGVFGCGVFAGLAFDPISGYPAMVHFPSPSVEEMQVRFVQWDGMTWQGETIVQGDGVSPALAYNDSGTPYISYISGAFGTLPTVSLWVAHFDGIDWVHELVDTVTGGGLSPDLSMDPNGLPTASYVGSTGELSGLKFAFKENP